MDKELLRLIIIAIGLGIIIVMVLWSLINDKKTRLVSPYQKEHPENNTNHDDLDVSPADKDLTTNDLGTFANKESDIPDLIQFNIVAPTEAGFKGKDLLLVFKKTKLEYGRLNIFEHLNQEHHVDFSVANMIEPGNFPTKDYESFSTSGIVFFMQTQKLDNPLAVFDKFIQTINLVADDLGGIKLDQDRLPVSEQTIQQYRDNLADALTSLNKLS